MAGKYILSAPIDEIFGFKTPAYNVLPRARIYASIKCEACWEHAAESRIGLKDG